MDANPWKYKVAILGGRATAPIEPNHILMQCVFLLMISTLLAFISGSFCDLTQRCRTKRLSLATIRSISVFRC